MYENLELEMFKRHVSSRDLAKICGISEGAMRNKRKGRAEFTLGEAEKILTVFPDCSWQYLFKRREEEVKQ